MSQFTPPTVSASAAPQYVRGPAGGASNVVRPFNVPADYAAVDVFLDDTSWIVRGQYVIVGGSALDAPSLYAVVNSVSLGKVNISRQPDAVNAVAGTTVPVGSTLNIAGKPSEIILTPTGVTAGTYGDANHIPQIRVDANGRVVSITLIPISAPAPSGDFSGTDFNSADFKT